MTTKEIGAIKNGIDRTGFSLRLPDGTRLTVIATVKLPPLEEMTPRATVKFDMTTGLKSECDDGGMGEAIELSEGTQAVTLMRKIEAFVNRMQAG